MARRVNGAAAAAFLMITGLAHAAVRQSAFERCDHAGTKVLNEISYQENNIPAKQQLFMSRIKESGAPQKEIVVAALLMLKGSGLMFKIVQNGLTAARQCQEKSAQATKSMTDTIEQLQILDSGLDEALAEIPPKLPGAGRPLRPGLIGT